MSPMHHATALRMSSSDGDHGAGQGIGSGPPAAIIMAAGKGTRMRSELPKVCHEVGGRPMVCAVVDACRNAGCDRIVVIVGYKQELVREALADESGVEFAVQEEQLGTGHAVRCAEQELADASDRDVFVLAGDGPLIRPETLKTLLARHRAARASATMATSVIDDPSGYGRIVRSPAGAFERIVEQKNATEGELKIREVNPSYYLFRCGEMFEALKDVKRNEASGEYYITDLPEMMLGEGKTVEVIDAVPAEDILSINTPEHLAEVDAIYRKRQQAAGVGGGA
ncbi:MAG: NTP transferase domain-containing protein [Planctomycetota bacterium]